MPVEETTRLADDPAKTPKVPESTQDQPSKGSAQGRDHRGHEQDGTAGEKDHRRLVDVGDARKHAR